MRSLIQKQHFEGARNSFDADSALVLDSSFTNALMQGAMLSDAMFVRCEFNSVSLYWASMFRTLFLECSFANVEFRGANMEESMFVHCTLIECDFSRDNVGAVTDLTTVSFTDSLRTDCKYDGDGPSK